MKWVRKHKRGNPEEQLQTQLAEEFETTLPPEVFWTAIGHGSQGKGRAAKLKRMGVRAGIPDFFFAHQRRAFFIELKNVGESPKPTQRAVHAWLGACGIKVAVCKSVNEVYRQLDSWGIPTRIATTSLESRVQLARRVA